MSTRSSTASSAPPRGGADHGSVPSTVRAGVTAAALAGVVAVTAVAAGAVSRSSQPDQVNELVGTRLAAEQVGLGSLELERQAAAQRASRGGLRTALPTAGPTRSTRALPALSMSAASSSSRAPATGATRTSKTVATRSTPATAAKATRTKAAKVTRTTPAKATRKATATASARVVSGTSASAAKATAKALVARRGWSSSHYSCLVTLWEKESNWNYRATNPSSGAYGIPQALPGTKMASAGSDWRTNPATQIAWGLGYIADRYGTPCGALSHSKATGWY